jgi:hypothetical protein
MRVGHNPGFAELAHHFDSETSQMSACALVEFSFEAGAWAGIGRARPSRTIVDSPKQPSPWTAAAGRAAFLASTDHAPYATFRIAAPAPLACAGPRPRLAALAAPRRFVWKETFTMIAGSRARWACGQVAWRPVHMSTGRC